MSERADDDPVARVRRHLVGDAVPDDVADRARDALLARATPSTLVPLHLDSDLDLNRAERPRHLVFEDNSAHIILDLTYSGRRAHLEGSAGPGIVSEAFVRTPDARIPMRLSHDTRYFADVEASPMSVEVTVVSPSGEASYHSDWFTL